MFEALGQLHGDKGVWKLMDRLGEEVAEVPVPGPIPRDVDTWEDYEAVLALSAAQHEG
jgi:molybdenum cofactor cytidylyltransferase